MTLRRVMPFTRKTSSAPCLHCLKTRDATHRQPCQRAARKQAMKFARIVEHVSRRHSAAECLKHEYIKYKKLKKLLKNEAGRSAFYAALLTEIQSVNRYLG